MTRLMTLTTPSHRIHLPIVGHAPEVPMVEPAERFPCGQNRMAYSFAEMLLTDPRRKHPVLECDEGVVGLAQHRAEDMQKRNYFGHTDPGGFTPNEWARHKGIVLPHWYFATGNNIESIAGNQQNAQDVLDAFWGSPGHRQHVFGLNAFWQGHTKYGVGFAENRTHEQLHSTVWVYISIP